MVGFSCQDLSQLIVNSNFIHAQLSIFTPVSEIERWHIMILLKQWLLLLELCTSLVKS